jgi:ferritin-like metal-binding protein YciE
MAAATKAMASTTMQSKLQEFFTDQLQDIYWAEKKIVRSLPKMIKAATTNQLRKAFSDHLEETKTHVERLEQVFEIIGEKARAKKCPAMAGIIDESEDVMDETDEGSAQRDVALIFAGQKVEHYEIATYGGMVALAATLGLKEAVKILQKTLSEEKNADTLLTDIAVNNINYEAAHEKAA